MREAEQREVTPAWRGGPEDGRFLSEAACKALAQRVIAMAVGGGHTQVMLESSWRGTVRWSRNRIRVAEDIRQTGVGILREINAAACEPTLNMLDDGALEAAMRRAERLLQLQQEMLGQEYVDMEYTEQHLKPVIWSEATYTQPPEARAEIARDLIQQAEAAGLVAAGDIQVSALGRAVINNRGRAMYYPGTQVEYSVTVRDPKGSGSGWAGISHWDWAKIDPKAVTQRAIEKCLASRNPVALEPGRYTTVLEPQAVVQLVGCFWGGNEDRRVAAERLYPEPPWGKGGNQSRLGEVVVDERLVVESDPMDPDLGQIPFVWNGAQDPPKLEVFHPTRWIDRGVLINLDYDLEYAIQNLGKNQGLPTSGAFRMRSVAPPVSIEEMIATTTRGLLVTQFTGGSGMLSASGYTRDGLWLIEHGKIAKPVKNFRFRENPYLLLQSNRLEQIGAPVRVFNPWSPVLVPALKVKDFNFTQLTDAI